MGGTGWTMTEFGWDVKYAGVQTLVAKVIIIPIVLKLIIINNQSAMRI